MATESTKVTELRSRTKQRVCVVVSADEGEEEEEGGGGRGLDSSRVLLLTTTHFLDVGRKSQIYLNSMTKHQLLI